jgi:hypothetical protein
MNGTFCASIGWLFEALCRYAHAVVALDYEIIGLEPETQNIDDPDIVELIFSLFCV